MGRLPLTLIAGRVVDERGQPVGNALVGVVGRDDTAVGRTNARGRFALGVATAEPVRVVTRKPGFGYGIRNLVAPWAEDVELVLPRTATITGRVLADSPRPFRVTLLRGGDRVGKLAVYQQWDGLFRISRVPPGAYALRVERNGTARIVPVSVTAGEEERIEIRLP